MDKDQFTEILRDWLTTFLKNKFKDYKLVDVILPGSNISKLNHDVIKSMDNYSSWDFKPDVLAILLDKDGKPELVFLNRSTSALSLKEIGEINRYAKFANAKLALLASTNGLSSEVNLLLLEDDIRNRLLKYEGEIIIFSWDEKNNRINTDSIIPLNKKDFLSN